MMVLPGFIKLWRFKSAENHQTFTITFFLCSFGFGNGGTLSVSSHCVERLQLSDKIHFSSQVTIRLRKGSFWLRRKRADETSKRLRLFSDSIHKEPIYSFF